MALPNLDGFESELQSGRLLVFRKQEIYSHRLLSKQGTRQVGKGKGDQVLGDRRKFNLGQ